MVRQCLSIGDWRTLIHLIKLNVKSIHYQGSVRSKGLLTIGVSIRYKFKEVQINKSGTYVNNKLLNILVDPYKDILKTNSKYKICLR